VIHEIAAEEQLPHALEEACLNLLARYDLSYQPAPAGPAAIRLRIQTPEGGGEANVPRPA
jgi:hypothetical protein